MVGAVKQTGLDKQSEPTLYLSLLQAPQSRMSLVVRTAGDPANLAAAVKAAIYAIDPDQPVYRIRTMDQALSELTAPQRLTLMLLTLFAVTALCLASIGIYGLVAYTVVQRTREVGIRIALGAEPEQIVRLIVAQGLGPTAIGIGLGGILSVAATSALASILVQASTCMIRSCSLRLLRRSASWRRSRAMRPHAARRRSIQSLPCAANRPRDRRMLTLKSTSTRPPRADPRTS